MTLDSLPRIRVVSAEIARDGCFLIAQRRANAVLPLLWEFPGGRVRDGEDDAAALRRQLTTRLGVDPDIGALAMEVVHAYDDYALTLAVYRCTLPDGVEPEAQYVEAVAWVKPEDFGDYEFPGADQATVRMLVSSEE